MPVLGTPVPEAAVYEHSNAPSRKYDVNLDSELPDTDELVLPEPQPSSMQLRPQCLLGLGVRAPVRPHEGRNGRARRVGIVGMIRGDRHDERRA